MVTRDDTTAREKKKQTTLLHRMAIAKYLLETLSKDMFEHEQKMNDHAQKKSELEYPPAHQLHKFTEKEIVAISLKQIEFKKKQVEFMKKTEEFEQYSKKLFKKVADIHAELSCQIASEDQLSEDQLSEDQLSEDQLNAHRKFWEFFKNNTIDAIKKKQDKLLKCIKAVNLELENTEKELAELVRQHEEQTYKFEQEYPEHTRHMLDDAELAVTKQTNVEFQLKHAELDKHQKELVKEHTDISEEFNIIEIWIKYF